MAGENDNSTQVTTGTFPTPPPATPGPSQLDQTIASNPDMPFTGSAGPAANLSSALPPDVPGSHRTLVGMLAGLGVALSATGKALATHGREGGAPDVVQFQAQQQAERRAGEQQEMQKSEFALRQKALTAQQNLSEFQLQKAKDFLPLEHQELLNRVNQQTIEQLEKLGVSPINAVAFVPGQSTAAHGSAVLKAMPGGSVTGGVAIPTSEGAHGEGKGATNVYNIDALNVNTNPDFVSSQMPLIKQAIDMAEAQGADKQVIAQARAQADVLSHGTSMPVGDFLKAQNQILLGPTQSASTKQQSIKTQEAASKAQQETEKADPLFKMENDPNEMSGEKSGAAIALLQSKLGSETDPAQKVRESRLLAQANNAHTQWLADVQSKENASQAAKQGDPNAAGAALAAGTLTLSDLKTRGMTPKFILDATAAAQKIDSKYNPSDEIVGEKLMGQQATTAFLGSAGSLLHQGGLLDQLQANGKALGNTSIPKINTFKNLLDYAAGKPQLAAFNQTLIGLSDDYGKVMGGGVATDNARDTLAKSFAAAQNDQQREAAIDAAREALKSQVHGRVGGNRYIAQRVDFDYTARPPDANVKVPGADGKLYWGNSQTQKVYGPVN